MPQITPAETPASASVTPPPKPDPEVIVENNEPTVSRPGGFKNDPDEPSNPNEEIERYREKLRR